MSRKRPDELVTWSVWLRDELAKKGCTARLTYDDKVDGDVLLLALAASERDRFVEITVARRKKGHAHLAVMGTTQNGVDAAMDALGRAHHEVSRFANAKRKFVHRIERLVSVLASGWAERNAATLKTAAFGEALLRLQQVIPEAIPMTGVGFHVDLAGADDEHRTRETYPTLSGAAVPVAQSWRGLAWDARNGRWLARAGTLNALLRGKSGADLERAGISLGDIALVGAAVVGAAAVASTLVGDNALEDEVQRKSGDNCWADALDPCDIVDCAFSAGDLGNCIPDCDLGGLDCGALDCGGLDCSL